MKIKFYKTYYQRVVFTSFKTLDSYLYLIPKVAIRYEKYLKALYINFRVMGFDLGIVIYFGKEGLDEKA